MDVNVLRTASRMPLALTAESSKIKTARNRIIRSVDSASTTRSEAPTVLKDAYNASTSASRQDFRNGEVKPSTNTKKRSRTDKEEHATPKKIRKLPAGMPCSTPASTKYDSGIEMTPECVAKPETQTSRNVTRAQSPCAQKASNKSCRKRKQSSLELEDDLGTIKKRRSARLVNTTPLIQTTDNNTLDARPRNGLEANSATAHSTHDSDSQPKDWDTTTMLSILGETVILQQRERTVLQHWLRSRDDHMMFWLNYGGQASADEYFRWTKRVKVSALAPR